MPVRTDSMILQLDDSVVVEMCIDQLPLAFRGKVSNLLPKVVWVNVVEPGCPPCVKELPEGHPVRLSVGRESQALVGETKFLSCLGPTRRLIAVERPPELKLIDRRAHLRVTIHRQVGIRLARSSAAGEGGHFAVGMSCDISLGGMSFESTVHMAVGDHVFVTMSLEQNRPLYALAQIVRLSDTVGTASQPGPDAAPSNGRRVTRAGVKWEAMAPADRERLQRFLIQVEKAAST